MDEKIRPSDILEAASDYRNAAKAYERRAAHTPYDKDYFLAYEIKALGLAEKKYGEVLAGYVRQEMLAALRDLGIVT